MRTHRPVGQGREEQAELLVCFFCHCRLQPTKTQPVAQPPHESCCRSRHRIEEQPLPPWLELCSRSPCLVVWVGLASYMSLEPRASRQTCFSSQEEMCQNPCQCAGFLSLSLRSSALRPLLPPRSNPYRYLSSCLITRGAAACRCLCRPWSARAYCVRCERFQNLWKPFFFFFRRNRNVRATRDPPASFTTDGLLATTQVHSPSPLVGQKRKSKMSVRVAGAMSAPPVVKGRQMIKNGIAVSGAMVLGKSCVVEGGFSV